MWFGFFGLLVCFFVCFHDNPFVYHAKKEYALKMSDTSEDPFPNRMHCSQTEITEWKKKSKVWQDRPDQRILPVLSLLLPVFFPTIHSNDTEPGSWSICV